LRTNNSSSRKISFAIISTACLVSVWLILILHDFLLNRHLFHF
jgi:hypothetical protein